MLNVFHQRTAHILHSDISTRKTNDISNVVHLHCVYIKQYIVCFHIFVKITKDLCYFCLSITSEGLCGLKLRKKKKKKKGKCSEKHFSS